MKPAASLSTIARERFISPLSPSQQRLWIHSALETDPALLNVSVAHWLRGKVDFNYLEQALRSVIRRHGSLRTSFVSIGDQPKQVVADDPSWKCQQLDMRHVAACEWRRKGRELARQDASTPFELDQSPLLRCWLVDGPNDESLMILTLHHLVCDRWSLGIISSEISYYYEARARQAEVELPTLKRDYLMYSDWQSEWVKSPAVRGELDYWRPLLRGCQPLWHPPRYDPAAYSSSYVGDRIELGVDKELLRQLEQCSSNRELTLNATLLAAWFVLLWQHSGIETRDDLVVAVPVSGRHRSTTKGVVGYFINLIPLRLDLSGNPTLIELVQRVGAVALAALAKQDVPFQEIASCPEIACRPLAQCVFAYQATPSLALNLGGVEASYEDVHNGTANFDLAVFLERQADELVGFVDFKQTQFGIRTVTELQSRYLAVLQQLVSSPQLHLGELLNFESPWPQPTASAYAPNTPELPLVTDRPQSPELMGSDSQLVAQVEREFCQVLGVSQVDGRASFFELGGTSLLAAQLFLRLSQITGRQLPLALLVQAPTARQLAHAIAQDATDQHWSPLVAIQPRGTRPPLFCVHGGGGNVIAYRRLADYLGSNQPIYGLQAKGLREGDAPFDSIETMAMHHVAALLEGHPAGPYVLAGHSLGAMVAYEMGQQLHQAGHQVPLLVLFDHPGPDVKLSRFDWLRWQWMNVRQLSWREQCDYIFDGLKYRWRTNPFVRRWRARRMPSSDRAGEKSTSYSTRMKLVEASLHALQTYEPQPYSGRITLFRARLGAPRIRATPSGGWQRVAEGGIDVHDVPGGHMNMFEEPHIKELGSRLASCLAKI